MPSRPSASSTVRRRRRGVARNAAVVAAALLLAACGVTATPKFDYARTSLGYRNSGLLGEGRVFFWDTDQNELINLGDSVPLTVSRRVGPQDMDARNVRGFDVKVSGAPNAAIARAVEADVAAYLSNESAFEVKNAEREISVDPRGGLYKTYAEIQPDDGAYRWRVRELDSNPRRYKLVVITDPVYATSESISVGGKAGGNVKISVPAIARGDVTINLSDARQASCTGQRALCFFNVFVAEGALVNVDGVQKLRLRGTDNVSRDKLTEAFRKLI